MPFETHDGCGLFCGVAHAEEAIIRAWQTEVVAQRLALKAPRSRFFDEIEDHMTSDAAEQSLRAIVSWARYAEAFAYDGHSQMFSLENPS